MIEKITKTVYRCACELPDCSGIDPKTGKPRPWDSEGAEPPDRCSWCKRRTWNRPDRRHNEPEVKWVTVKTKQGGTTRVRERVKDRGQKSARPTIHLPKPKKVRPAED